MRSKGFTLIEVLIALVIVSVAALALGSFGITTLGSGQVSRERLTAVHLAEQILEHWQNDTNDRAPTIDASCVQSDAMATPAYPVTTVCTPTTGVGISYTIVVDQSVATGPLASDLNNMQAFSTPGGYSNSPNTKIVTVSWSNRGQTRSVFLTHMSTVQ